MHGIHQEGHFALGVEADAVHGVMPVSVMTMKPVNVSCLCLEMVVPITNEEHTTT